MYWMMEESTLDHLWPDLSRQKARPEGKNGRCPGRANADHERHAAYNVYGTGSLNIELKTDSNDAKRASKATDAKVGEAREKATEENITIQAGKAADSGTFVSIPVLKPLENNLPEISKEHENFIQNAKSEDRRRTLRELIERRLAQIITTKKDAHIDQNANLEDTEHKMRASVDRTMDQMWEESDKSPAKKRVLQGARRQAPGIGDDEGRTGCDECGCGCPEGGRSGDGAGVGGRRTGVR